MANFTGLRFTRRLFRPRQLRHCRRGYRRLKPDRSPSAAVKLLRWILTLKQLFYAPFLGGGEEKKPSPPPKGHLVVYVGGGDKEMGPLQRYFVPVIFCNHPLFEELLREAEAEFEFHHPAGITIPCPAWRFERVTNRIIAGSGAVGRRRSSPRILLALE